jgi:hypothetical protein
MSPNNSSSAAASFNCGNDKLAKLLVEYFSKFDGKTESWTQVQPLLVKMMHRELVLVTDEEELPYDFVMNMIEEFFKSGGKSNLKEIDPRQANGVITLVIENVQGDGTVDLIPQWIKVKDDQIVRIEAESSPAKFGALVKNIKVSSKQAKASREEICENDAFAKLLVEYFSKFDSKTESWTHVQPLLLKMMHRDVVLVTDEGELPYEFVMNMIEEFFKSGGKSNLTELNPRQANGVIKLVVDNVQGDGTVDLIRQWIKVKDDQIIRIEAESSPAKFGALIKNIKVSSKQAKASREEICDSDAFAKLLVEYFSKFDGTKESWSNVEPLLVRMMHKEVVLVTDEGNHQYDFVTGLIEKFLQSGGKSNLIELHPRQSDDIIKLVVEHIHADGTIDLIRQWIKIKDDQIVRIEAESSPAEFGLLVKNVEANSHPGIKLLREFFATSDGSSKAYRSFETLFEQIYHPDAWSKAEFKRFAETYVEGGGIVKIENVYKSGADTVSFTLRLYSPDGSVLSQGRTATFRGQKIIKVETADPTDAKKFKVLVQSVLESTAGTTTPMLLEHNELDNSQTSSAA